MYSYIIDFYLNNFLAWILQQFIAYARLSHSGGILRLIRTNILLTLFWKMIFVSLHMVSPVRHRHWRRSRWLAYRFWHMYPYLLERVLRQFRYLQGIFRGPKLVFPLKVLHRNIHVLFTYYHEHLVLEDVRSVSAPSPWSIVYCYI